MANDFHKEITPTDDVKTEALEVASLAGHIMLENGAEIARVEQVMDRIASTYGADSRNFFVLSNGIFTTGNHYAHVEHIPFHGTQLDKVVAVSDLSRHIEKGCFSLSEVAQRLRQIRLLPAHPAWEQILASALGSGAFCAIFGGSLIDCAISTIIGMLLWTMVLFFSIPFLSKITSNIVGGIFVTILCIISYHLPLNVHLGNIIIGAIIPLIPGVPFTNGVRDLAAEDYIAGGTRLADALMVFLCIALGVCTVFFIDSRIEGEMIQLGGVLTDDFTSHWALQLIAAFIGTAAFAVLFGAPRKFYWHCGVCGTIGWIVYIILMRLCDLSSVESTFFATTAVVASAYFFAQKLQCPVIVFLVCGIFPLVPGAGVFWTSYYVVSDQLPLALSCGFIAVKCTFAIVFGIIIITELRRRFNQ